MLLLLEKKGWGRCYPDHPQLVFIGWLVNERRS